MTEQQQLLQYGPVAQLVRAPACHAGGRRFEPDPGRFVGMSAACREILQRKISVTIAEIPPLPHKILLRKLSRGPRSGGCRDKCTKYAAVAHLVERHLAKVEVASSSLVGRSNGVVTITPNMVTWPSGKARVCKTLIHQFKSGRHLQKVPGSFGFRDFLLLFILQAHIPCDFRKITEVIRFTGWAAPGKRHQLLPAFGCRAATSDRRNEKSAEIVPKAQLQAFFASTSSLGLSRASSP